MAKRLTTILCLLVLAAAVGMVTMSSPLMNDITTSVDAPPEFQDIARMNPKRDYTYPDKFMKMQKEHYGDVAPLVLPNSADEVFAKVRELAESYSWDIVGFNAESYVLEAVAKTRLLKFRDDIIVELRKLGNDRLEVHMRSKSRLGRNDFGANATRIKEFLGELAKALSNP